MRIPYTTETLLFSPIQTLSNQMITHRHRDVLRF